MEMNQKYGKQRKEGFVIFSWLIKKIVTRWIDGDLEIMRERIEKKSQNIKNK